MALGPILIAGVHRSGTSLVAQLLNSCGLYLGEKDILMPRDPVDNPTGYWEYSEATEFSNRLLREVGATWDEPAKLFSDSWVEYKNRDELINEGLELFKPLASSGKIWGWKDPRNTLIIPFWRELFPELKVVICLRSPMEVAFSLSKRLDFHVDFPDALRLWRDYYEILTNNLNEAEHIVTHYETFFYSPKEELERLCNFVGLKPSVKVLESSTKLINKNYHRGVVPDDVINDVNDLPLGILDLYKKYCAKAGKNFERSVKDKHYQSDRKEMALKRVFAVATSRFDRDSWRYSDLQKENQELRISISNLENDIRELRDSISNLRKENEELRLSISNMQKENEELRLSKTNLLKENKELLLSKTNLQNENEELQLSKSILGAENEKLQLSKTNLQNENKELQLSITELQKEYQELKLLNADLRKEKKEIRLSSIYFRRELESKNNPLLLRFIRFLFNPIRKLRIRFLLGGPQRTPAYNFLQSNYAKSVRKLIKRSGLANKSILRLRQPIVFDQEWYLENYPDVKIAGVNPLSHYLEHGWKEGRNPNAFFDANWYLDNNPDVVAAGIEPFSHYLEHGWKEGRNPSLRFDQNWYREKHPDVAASGIEPLTHYLTFGRYEGRLYNEVYSNLSSLPDDTQGTLEAIDPDKEKNRDSNRPQVRQSTQAKKLKSSIPLKKRYTKTPRKTSKGSINKQDLLKIINREIQEDNYVISLSHDNYTEVIGGVQICVSDGQIAYTHNGVDYLHIYPTNPQPVLAKSEEGFSVSINCNGSYLAECNGEMLLEVLQGLDKNLREIIIHQLLGFDIEWVIKLLSMNGSETVFFWLHDYFSLCPNYNLLRNDIIFCDAPDVNSNACNLCLYGEERIDHVASMERLFNQCEITIIAPSEFAFNYWLSKSNLPIKTHVILPHAALEENNQKAGLARKTNKKRKRTPIKIAYLGYPAYHKGWETYKELANKFSSDPNYKFYYFGADAYDNLSVEWVKVEVNHTARNAMVEALKGNDIDVAMLWSIWPETFSYTLYESISAGCFIISNADSGNIQEKITKDRLGIVLENDEKLFELFSSDKLFNLVKEFLENGKTYQQITFNPGTFSLRTKV